jgi:hypothetical protein
MSLSEFFGILTIAIVLGSGVGTAIVMMTKPKGKP